MRSSVTSIGSIGMLLLCIAGPALAAGAAGAPEGSIEQKSFDDLAGTMADHLRATADLLAKLQETRDPAVRRVEIERYARAMETTAKLDRAMQALSPGTTKPMKCAMMGGAEAPKVAAAAKAETETETEAEKNPGSAGESGADHSAHH